MPEPQMPGLPPRAKPPALPVRRENLLVALRTGRTRRRRRVGLAGLSSALIVVVALSLTGDGSSRSSLEPVSPPNAVDEDRGDASPSAYPAGVPPIVSAQDAGGSLPTPGADSDQPAEPPSIDRSSGQRGRGAPAPATRSKVRQDLPKGCGTGVEWCLLAEVVPAGSHEYTLVSSLCVNPTAAGVPYSVLDFATTQEVDFELLAAGRVIWRWSDTQTFRPEPHQLSAMVGECFTWQTPWDQYDARGQRVGKARLVMRARHLAKTQSKPEAATFAFFTAV